MVEFLVTAAAEVIVEKALSLAANEFATAWGYKESLTSLNGTLKMICAVLQDAERRNTTDVLVKEWMKQLRDVASEADDLLDEVEYEVLRKEVQKRNHKIQFPNLKKLSFRRKMGHKIEKINKRLSKINTRAQELRLLINEPHGPVTKSLLKDTDSRLEEYKIVGRDKDAQHIVELLTESRKEDKLTIVPVVGMGGIGKTALAKSVFNNPKIQKHFDVLAWSCVSVEVDINRLLEMIYESLTGNKCEKITRDNLIKMLEKELGSKRYLLVLDDVWDEKRNIWDEFRSCMLKVNSQNGNAIIVTTRKLEIGTNDMKKNSRNLQVLSNDVGWLIFTEMANPLQELEEIGRDIVKKCGGLPLLVRVIGSMLRDDSDKDKWLFVQENMVQGEEERDILKNLKLSFEGLPNSISKKCFGYCSIFEKDTVMKREDLIQVWMALGLLQVDVTRNSDMEDVGNDIFKILVSNSLFQDVEMDEYGYMYSCKMHDLVHNLSLQISGDESLCLLVPTSDKVHNPQLKHLSMQQEKDSKLLENMTSRTLHTLFLRGVVTHISFKDFKCLRIIKLSRTELSVIHDSVGDLVHLRYLDLSDTDIEVLPKSITKLHQLQTLKLLCSKFKKFPEGMRNLISLRHLEFKDNVISPKDLGQLTSLRTLSFFSVGREKGCQIEELGCLKHLGGKLVIPNLEEVGSKEEASKADIVGKKNLYKIEFRWKESNEGAGRNDKDILEGLKTPENVKSLTIVNYSSDYFPEWVMKMSTNNGRTWIPLDKLVDITLSGCRNVLSLPEVWNLPLLRGLKLRDMDSLTSLSGSVDLGSSVPLSRSLRKLELDGMKRLVKWTDAVATNSSTMISPVLETLSIWDCPQIIHLDEQYPHPLVELEIFLCENLESIGSLQGLTSLERLEISYCDSLIGIPDLHNLGGSLRQLYIRYCEKLTSLPGGIDSLTLLDRLVLGSFSEELDSFPSLKGMEKLRSSNLRFLWLHGYDHWDRIPEEVKHLTSLEQLWISNFGIREIPKWLTNMSSIRYIDFSNCPGLDDDADSVLKGAPTQAEIVDLNGKRIIDRTSG